MINNLVTKTPDLYCSLLTVEINNPNNLFILKTDGVVEPTLNPSKEHGFILSPEKFHDLALELGCDYDKETYQAVINNFFVNALDCNITPLSAFLPNKPIYKIDTPLLATVLAEDAGINSDKYLGAVYLHTENTNTEIQNLIESATSDKVRIITFNTSDVALVNDKHRATPERINTVSHSLTKEEAYELLNINASLANT